MKVIANRQMIGEYGQVSPDQEFECRDEKAQELLKMGKVRHAAPPKVQYETKVIKPSEAPEVSAREPFPGDGPDDNEEPETVDSEGNKVLSSANLLEGGTAGGRRRGRRSGSDSGE